MGAGSYRRNRGSYRWRVGLPPNLAISAALVAISTQSACSGPGWPTTDYTGCATGRPAAPGSFPACETEAEVQKVIDEHRDALNACWSRSRRLEANVCARFTIGPDGTVHPVDLSSDAPGVAACVGDEMGGWRFPAHGCSQKTMVPLRFVHTREPVP